MSQISFNPRITGRRFAALILTAFAVALTLTILASPAQASGSINYYSNNLKSSSGRKEVRQVRGSANCDRGGSSKALRFELGKKARECGYRVPVVGRDLVMNAKAYLFKSTPKKVARRTYVSVNLRQANDGSRYQLAVFPVQGKYQLRKIFPNGKIKYLAHGKERKVIGKLGEANRIALRAYNGDGGRPRGTARLIVMINGKKMAVVDDRKGNQLKGRDSSFSIGSRAGARGAKGSFTGLRVNIPNPF